MADENSVLKKTQKNFVSRSMGKRVIIQIGESLKKKLGREPTEDEVVAEIEKRFPLDNEPGDQAG